MRAEFSRRTKNLAWLRCHDERGIPRCEGWCGKQAFGGRRAEFHHEKPAAFGGENTLENCKVLCPKCHRDITRERDRPAIDKSTRVREKFAGIRRSRYSFRR